MELELALSDQKGSESLTLVFRVFDTPIGRKYFRAVQERPAAHIHEPDRLYYFPNELRDRAWIARELNACIDAINAHSPDEIRERATADLSQPALNVLHHHFERCRGGFAQSAPFYRDAPVKIRRTLEAYNLLIHQYEGLVRNEAAMASGRPTQAKIIVTFGGRRHPLEPEDLEQFRWDFEFGTWCLNYQEVGKHLWDMFRDKDTSIGDANIRPLRTFGADGKILFSRRTGERAAEAKRAFDAWLGSDERMVRLGFKKDDPRNTVGVCSVALLDREHPTIRGMSEAKILALVGRFPLVRAVTPRA